MLDLSGSLIAIRLLARPVTLRKFVAGEYNEDGMYVQPASTDSTISAAITAMYLGGRGGVNVNTLPEGISELATHYLWTEADIAVEDDIASKHGDRIIDGGDEYRILHIANRYEAGFIRAILGRVDERERRVRYDQ